MGYSCTGGELDIPLGVLTGIKEVLIAVAGCDSTGHAIEIGIGN